MGCRGCTPRHIRSPPAGGARSGGAGRPASALPHDSQQGRPGWCCPLRRFRCPSCSRSSLTSRTPPCSAESHIDCNTHARSTVLCEHLPCIAGGAGFKHGRRRSALLCWLDGLAVAGAGAWLLRLLRLRPADGSGSRKPLLGSASAKDAAGATAAASAGLTASATGVEAFTPRHLHVLTVLLLDHATASELHDVVQLTMPA